MPEEKKPEEKIDTVADVTEKAEEVQAEIEKTIEPVAEVIEPQTPPASPANDGIDALNKKVDDLFAFVKDNLTKPNPIEKPEEVQPHAAQEEKPKPAPRRGRIKLLRGSRGKRSH